MKPIVHIILNSHLDPVWLWRLEQGIDEALSTARTASSTGRSSSQ